MITQDHYNHQDLTVLIKSGNEPSIYCWHTSFTQSFLHHWSLFVCVWNRLPEADDSGREHHSLNVPLPVAACVRSHPARLPPPLPGRSCAVSHGPPLQWTGWPHQARAATGGTNICVEVDVWNGSHVSFCCISPTSNFLLACVFLVSVQKDGKRLSGF